MVNENGGKWLRPCIFFFSLLLPGWVLGARLPGTDKVALRLYNAPALDNNGVTQDPLKPPVSDAQVPRALLHRLLECNCRHQLWKNK